MLQKLINLIYRFPRSKIKTYRRFGGYSNYLKMKKGQREMNEAVKLLPASPSYPDGLSLYFLTGKNYIHQTLFCISSLLKISKERYKFIIVDDGSFTSEINDTVSRKLPGAIIVNKAEIDRNVNRYLPADSYPLLNHKRKVYPHIKKLTDIHTISPDGWKVVLDSDMLFWNEPLEMVNWLKRPDRPIHMVDCDEAYGYSTELMHKICGNAIPELLNVGVIGLNSSTINWGALEKWISELEVNGGTSYYLEQALTAMLIGATPSLVLNKEQYKVNPDHYDFEKKNGVLHHYVDLSKAIYFKKAWKFFV